jgi:hypothetical protein
MTDSTNDDGEVYPPPFDHEVYGFTERELAFKLLASHALVDAEFFNKLRDDPRAAAEELHISLTEGDINYITNDVKWESLTSYADDIRDSLNLTKVTNSW